MLIYFHPADLSPSDIFLFIFVILFNIFVFVGIPFLIIWVIFKVSKNKKRRDVSKGKGKTL